MTPRWEIREAPPELDGVLFMDAVLRPNRSLSLTAFRLMLIVVIVINVAVAAAFVAHGAYPVAGFLGLDVLALWLAFRINYRAAHAEERVRLAQSALHIERRDARGTIRHWVLNPIWAQVAEDGRGVAVRGGKGSMRLGTFLSPAEREEFATALREALFRAKRGY